MIVYILLAASAISENLIPDYCVPILETWDAKDAKELRLRVLEYWESSATKISGHYGPKSKPLNIRFGGTTKELIDDKANWDLAIVSSKEVDLQALADEGLIMSYGNGPFFEESLHQWLLPEQVQNKLPVHPIELYCIYCYAYDPQTDEATFLICQENIGRKKNSPRAPATFANQIIASRSAEQMRALEGICRVNNWVLEDGAVWTVDDLLQNPEDWDVADLLIRDESELAALYQAGLLADFSQDRYWLERDMNWPVPSGIFSDDGTLIAIPYVQLNPDAGTFRVLIVNEHAPNSSQALDYVKHFVKSYEWIYSFISGEKTEETDVPKEIQKYGICIYKDHVDW